MSSPRRLREWEQAHDSLSELASRLSVRKYQEALDEAYRGPTGQGQRTTGGSVSDPTATALQSTGKRRYALRRANEELTKALLHLEEAADRLEEIGGGRDEVGRWDQAAAYLRLAQRTGRL